MRTNVIVLGILSVFLALWIGWGVYVIYTTERPPHSVIQQLSSRAEIRQYDEQTWISTSFQNDNASFPVLASYIFGSNQSGQKIAMTAPVITDQEMSFILPGNMSMENAPRPNGQPIEFTRVPARKLATLQFSFWTPQDRVERKTTELIELLNEKGIQTSGQPFLMRYNDPWTPPFLRRNEIAIEIP